MLESKAPSVIIGAENALQPIRVCSFVGMPYHVSSDTVGSIGVLGPTRMQYAGTISALNYLTRRLEHCVAMVSAL
jgi:heat-inducible transcriptional repressor